MDIQVKQATQGYRAGVGALVCVACCNTKTIVSDTQLSRRSSFMSFFRARCASYFMTRSEIRLIHCNLSDGIATKKEALILGWLSLLQAQCLGRTAASALVGRLGT